MHANSLSSPLKLRILLRSRSTFALLQKSYGCSENSLSQFSLFYTHTHTEREREGGGVGQRAHQQSYMHKTPLKTSCIHGPEYRRPLPASCRCMSCTRPNVTISFSSHARPLTVLLPGKRTSTLWSSIVSFRLSNTACKAMCLKSLLNIFLIKS